MTRHSFTFPTEPVLPSAASRIKAERLKYSRHTLCEQQHWRCAFCEGTLRWVRQERGCPLPDDAAVAVHLTTRLHFEHGLEPGRKVAACWACAKRRSAELLAEIPLEELHDRSHTADESASAKPLRVPLPRPADDAREAFVTLQVHRAAVAAVRADPSLVDRALKVLSRWRNPLNSRFDDVWQTWETILMTQDWSRVLDEQLPGRELRRHRSPLAALLPRAALARIATEARAFAPMSALGPRTMQD